MKKHFGSIPLGMDNPAVLNAEVFLYNPDNLPGIHEIGQNPIAITESGATTLSPCIVPTLSLVIDGKLYEIAMSGFTEDDYEDVI